jgi:methylmalonyl-CoA mutase C-terminal domain/subunit
MLLSAKYAIYFGQSLGNTGSLLLYKIIRCFQEKNMAGKYVRILIAKPGLDGHDRGAKYVARALRDSGYEVIYTGIRQTPKSIVQTAIQEDVNFLGLSLLSGAHKELFTKVVETLKEKGADDIIVFGGGTIPSEDIPFLKKKGVRAVFTPGTRIKEIVDFIESFPTEGNK